MNWSITKLKCYANINGFVDVVYRVWWSCVETDGKYRAEVCSSCDLPEPKNEFILYSNLTENDVLNWIWSNGVDKAQTETLVANELNAKKHPTVLTLPLPWA